MQTQQQAFHAWQYIHPQHQPTLVHQKDPPPLQKAALLLCGDFNTVADHSLGTTSKAKRLPPAFQPLLRASDLFDVWRCQPANERNYSFHSPRHNTYSQIDVFLVDRMLL